MDEPGTFRYRPDVLEHLLRHGVRPTSRTRPALVRDFVRDLYKYEIRCLRDRYLRDDFPKKEYAGRVDALRRRYLVLALPAREFVELQHADSSGRSSRPSMPE
jgi:hypothetical protein